MRKSSAVRNSVGRQDSTSSRATAINAKYPVMVTALKGVRRDSRVRQRRWSGEMEMRVAGRRRFNNDQAWVAGFADCEGPHKRKRKERA